MTSSPGARRRRTADATAAAQAYAPKPNGSALTYGLVATSLLLALTFVAGGYFAMDVTGGAWPLAALAVIAFAGGGCLRLWRQREHLLAVGREYGLRRPQLFAAIAPSSSSQQKSLAPVTSLESGIVTFRSKFILPGLDRPHAPGSFQVHERRERLELSWDAFKITKTIMLTNVGTVEALDVKADDLAAALLRDGTPLT